MNKTRFEIFCGTGGVGKTTLSTSRALYLRECGHKVALMTIDPSHRLKQLLNLKNQEGGIVETIQENLDVLLINPASTLKILAEKAQIDFTQNSILSTIARPFGGMNEIFSAFELYQLYTSQKYDVIVIDTAPGEHFIDFLESSKKMLHFFDGYIIEIFKILSPSSRSSLIGKIIQSGTDKLLHYLEKVTAPQFIRDFIEAVNLFHLTQPLFKEVIPFMENELNCSDSLWYLVTSSQQNKNQQGLTLYQKISTRIKGRSILAMNFFLPPEILSWAPKSAKLKKLKNNLVHNQDQVKQLAHQYFDMSLEFPDIFHENLEKQLQNLTEQWRTHDKR